MHNKQNYNNAIHVNAEITVRDQCLLVNNKNQTERKDIGWGIWNFCLSYWITHFCNLYIVINILPARLTD